MSMQHLRNTATVEQATEVVRSHGHVIIDELVPGELIEQILTEMQPYIDVAPCTARVQTYLQIGRGPR